MSYLLLFLIILAVAGYFVTKSYNEMRKHAENVKESFSNISVVMRKKVSLVNQLITVVGNYQESEKLVMLQVSSDSVQSVQQASSQTGRVLAQIGNMAQRFPELKSNQQYHRLMDSMQMTEGDVQNARLVYNRNAKVFNTARTSLPTVFYASALGFGQAPYLSIEAEDLPGSAVPQVMMSDDSERVNALLGVAGKKAMTAARQLGQQSKVLAEKGSTLLQQARMGEQFHYVTAQGKPMGPVTRMELDELFRQGAVTAETSVMGMSTKMWTTYGALEVVPAAGASGD